jgi:hypothetical protein
MLDSNRTGCCPSIASMVASHASQLVWWASGVDHAMSAGSGRSTCVWLAKYDQHGVWRRIRLGYCQLMIDGRGELFSERWSRWAIIVDGVYGALAMSALRTDATESFWWPTFLASEAAHGGPQQRDSMGRPTLGDAVTRWPTPRAEKIDGQASLGYSPTLHQAVTRWPTPKASNGNGAGRHGQGSPDLQTVVTRWPTPQARDWKSGQVSEQTFQKNARPLNEYMMHAAEPTPEPQYLNADWVETLMGLPRGWTIIATKEAWIEIV